MHATEITVTRLLFFTVYMAQESVTHERQVVKDYTLRKVTLKSATQFVQKLMTKMCARVTNMFFTANAVEVFFSPRIFS